MSFLWHTIESKSGITGFMANSTDYVYERELRVTNLSYIKTELKQAYKE